jgi:hypothetical protein
MSDELNMQLPLDGFGDDRPWALPEQEPTTLITLVARRSAADGDRSDRCACRRAWPRDEVMGEMEPDEDDGEVQWIVIVELPGMPFPVMLWAEPAKPRRPMRLILCCCAKCKWVIGAETVLGKTTRCHVTRF